MLLTLSIKSKKRSVINKLEKASKTFQHFKNLLYLCAIEYFANTRDIKPFTQVSFLGKFVKCEVELPYENESIKKWKEELRQLWQEKIGSDTVKMLINVIAREYKAVLSLWKLNQKANLPTPKKLDSLYSFTIETNPNMVVDKRKLKSKKKSNHIVVRIGKAFGAVRIKIPKSLNFSGHLKIRWNKDQDVEFLINYEVDVEKVNLNKSYFLSIDLGIKNLLTVISNKENIRSFIIDGNPVKSFNQWVNKLSAKLQSEGKEREHKLLWNYRNKRLKHFFSSVANFLISLCLQEGIGTIVISKSLTEEYQRKGNKGKKFNQTFRSIPFGKLINTLKYKCELAGIKFKIVDESYTSKTSSISGNIEIIKDKAKDKITEQDLKGLQLNGKRIKRGLFKDLKLNKVFNADLNGALNIAIKALGKNVRKSFLKLRNWLSKLCNPVRINLFRKYSLSSLLKGIRDSKSYYLNGSSEGHLLTITNKN